jgi:hypothetical protein
LACTQNKGPTTNFLFLEATTFAATALAKSNYQVVAIKMAPNSIRRILVTDRRDGHQLLHHKVLIGLGFSAAFDDKLIFTSIV